MGTSKNKMRSPHLSWNILEETGNVKDNHELFRTGGLKTSLIRDVQTQPKSVPLRGTSQSSLKKGDIFNSIILPPFQKSRNASPQLDMHVVNRVNCE